MSIAYVWPADCSALRPSQCFEDHVAVMLKLDQVSLLLHIPLLPSA